MQRFGLGRMRDVLGQISTYMALPGVLIMSVALRPVQEPEPEEGMPAGHARNCAVCQAPPRLIEGPDGSRAGASLAAAPPGLGPRAREEWVRRQRQHDEASH